MSMTNKSKKGFTTFKVSSYIFSYSFLLYPIILFIIFYVYVNINSIILAFQNITLEGQRSWVGFANFKMFLKGLTESGLIRISFFNSIKIYFINLVICMPLYIVFSWLLFKKVFGSPVIRIVIMLPSIISSFVFCLVFRSFAGAPLQQFMIGLGAENFPNLVDDSNYALGTTIFYQIWISFSTSLIVYPNAMRSIDPALFESGRIDGMCTMWQELRYIILPLIFPTVSTFLIVGFSGMFSGAGPLVAFYMYSAPAQAYTMGYYILVETLAKASNPTGYPQIAAGGLMLTMIMAPLTLLLRHILEKLSPVEG